MNNYIKYSALGFQMIIIIGLFSFAGYKTDQVMHHQTQWVTAVLSLCGVFVSLYIVLKSLKD
ncbi:MAG: AtpZ/AtpI family protein [Mucilaginibacter sp.]|uniref:AtpZ/AtpI family protein n=1 Tax=Mucilaginibacter sp. TaxID=1882438 RepID=UPI0034E44D2F